MYIILLYILYYYIYYTYNFLCLCIFTLFLVLAAASMCGFIYLAMRLDWKRILVASLSVAGLHAFGVAPFWENFWFTALFSVCPICCNVSNYLYI